MKSTINCIENPDEAVRFAKNILLDEEGIVCVPTETVYGLICLPKEKVIQKLINIKGRPENKPFALFVSSYERAQREAAIFTPSAQRLAKEFWPGPLTIIVNAEQDCPYQFNGSIGFRCPDYPLIHDILNVTDGLLVNTSLNKSGNSPVWDLGDADESIHEVDLILDAGKLSQKEPSTVVDCRTDEILILREGAIAEKEIKNIF